MKGATKGGVYGIIIIKSSCFLYVFLSLKMRMNNDDSGFLEGKWRERKKK